MGRFFPDMVSIHASISFKPLGVVETITAAVVLVC